MIFSGINNDFYTIAGNLELKKILTYKFTPFYYTLKHIFVF